MLADSRTLVELLLFGLKWLLDFSWVHLVLFCVGQGRTEVIQFCSWGN